MPELPEVQTVVNQLAAKIKGGVFERAVIKARKMASKNFVQLIKGQKIKNIFRKGKMIVMDLHSGHKLLAHLKMTGQLIFIDPKGKASGGGHPINFKSFNILEPNKFTRLILDFQGGAKLLFHDIRKFGWMRLVSASEYESLALKYGLDPLEEDFTLKNFSQILGRRPKMKIKQLLLSQELIAGIGNIYADESLFAAKINPARIAGTLTKQEIKKLRQEIISVLKKALKLGGTSFNTFLGAGGQRGKFVEKLRVYKRGGQPCFVCSAKLQKTKIGGRGTVYCLKCQA